MKEASLALGHPLANDLQGGNYSASGITAGAILGIGRAIGETAVLMVGNAVIHTFCLLEQFHHLLLRGIR
jgi:phosphate transport system permease protein